MPRIPRGIRLVGFLVSIWVVQGAASAAAAPLQWTPDQRLTANPADSLLTYNFSRAIAVDDAGRVHVVWYDGRDGNPEVYYKRSDDGGTTWGADARLSMGAGANVHPAIAVSGANVYVVWHGATTRAPRVYFKRSTDGGATWGGETAVATPQAGAAHASLAVSDGRLHLVWGDNRDGQTEIYYRRSADAGVTWEPERRLTDLPFESWTPSVAASGQTVCLAFVDTRDGNEEEYSTCSADEGATWGPNTRLTNNPANSWAPSVAMSGKTVHVVWFDQMDAKVTTHDAEAKLDEAMKVLGLPVEPQASSSGVLVAMHPTTAKQRAAMKAQRIQDETPGWVQRGGDETKLQGIMHALQALNARAQQAPFDAEKKLDEAMVLLGLPVTETSPAPVASAEDLDALKARVQEKIQRIQAAAPGWVQRGGDQRQLETKLQAFDAVIHGSTAPTYEEKERKLDEALQLLGVSFDPTKETMKMYYQDAMMQRIEGKAQQIQAAAPDWVKRGGDQKQLEGLLRDFQRMMTTALTEWEVYYRRSLDGGKTWEPLARLTNAPGLSQRPSLAVEGKTLHVVWFDARDGNPEVYDKRSTDEGATWEPDVRLTNDPADSLHPMVAVRNGIVHVVWFDARDGNHEIYYKRSLK